MKPDIYIGVMSGTSLDGIDVAAVCIDDQFSFLAAQCIDIPAELRRQILALTQAADNEIERMGRLDIDLGKLFAASINQLIKTADIDIKRIAAVGCHGQTIRHRPQAGFTLQIGDPNTIAEITGLTTISDFRRRDLANGGQGAPLVPAFHNCIFRSAEKNRVILNIGGMSNITVLRAKTASSVIGYDTGPGNVLLDAWINKHSGTPYDKAGQWANSGQHNQRLLQALLNLPFFTEPPPKSTGREQFNLDWLERVISDNGFKISPVDIQATLLEMTARSIADAINAENLSDPELYICGGGVHNHTLVKRLGELIHTTGITTTEELGLHPDWVEASAFAWLAHQTLNQLTGNLPSVTGATQERILGGIYQA
ncbi:anhydro-N-acetylmuramic acid kinase [Neptunomonas antarctica]|uniref:Anhydro-N-acetylmuramic acid kinase n=1 Tax=Neptunomonas antarctica TaxID=619304 RepID=A0A1N7PLZ5_9GAMM|nr:anhydro-N-acetylmuramic acid kinase [Neptunomonas antarctica]SIT11622.1 anhydro-N-acetylmuramic acid kinase [Neptunomonas antarctica]